MIMRADPEQAARGALAVGDTRLYMVESLALFSPGVRHSMRAEERYGYKLLPGVTDMVQTAEEDRYNSDAVCWASRYNRVLAGHLDEVVVAAPDPCGPVRPR